MELFDLYDSNRQPTGRTMVRGSKTPDGFYRLVVHVCIFNRNGQLLIQQRQPFKEGWSNMWDITVGGSVIFGETSQQGAHRELLEELGLDISFDGIVPAFTTAFHGGFDDVYILNAEPDLSGLHLQYEEVQSVAWASKSEILAMIDDGRFIPYGKEFVEYLFFRRDHLGNFCTD